MQLRSLFLSSLIIGASSLAMQASWLLGGDDTSAIVAEAQLSLVHDIELTSVTASRVSEVLVREGDRVVAGQVLVQFDSRIAKEELAAALYDAQAALAESKNDVDERYALATEQVHRSELQRLESANLRYGKSISESELQRCEVQIKQSQLAIEQARHKRELAVLAANKKLADVEAYRAKLDQLTLRAPMDGVIARVDAKAGAWLNPGGPALRLIQTDRLRAEALIEGAQVRGDLVGRIVRFERAVGEVGGGNEAGSHVVIGRVVYVSSELHPVTGQARVWCELEMPSAQWLAGMRGMLRIE